MAIAVYPETVRLGIPKASIRPAPTLCGVLFALCLGASAWPVIPGASAAWIEPVSISQLDASAREPRIAVDAAGNLTAVWTSGTEGSRSIRSAFRPAGGSWETPFNRMTSSFDCHDPRLAVNPAGAAVVTADCEKEIGGATHVAIRAAYRPAASWNASSEVPGSANGKDARVGIDDSGNARAVWAGTGSTVQSSYRPAAGTWSGVAQVSTVGKSAFNPNVGVSPAGYAYAVWREKREGPVVGDPVVHAKISTSLKGAAWSAPFNLTVDTGSGAVAPVTEGEPQIAINADAERMMAWSIAGANETMGERTAFADLAGLSEPVKFISEPPAHVEIPQIALDASGLGVATWRSGNEFLVKAATTGSLSGAWSSPVTLAGPGGLSVGTEPDVAAGPAGTATVVWRSGVTVTASSRTGGGAFGPATPISNGAHSPYLEPQVTMDDAGDAIAAWSASDMGSTHIAVAVNDVTPPLLSAIVTPSSVEAGASASMSASATDTWSSSTASWDFGDGTSATGGSVSHSYAGAGDKTVTVTATDAVGNTTSQTRTISVTPSSGGQGPGGGGGGGAQKHKLALTATVVKQPWSKILKAKAIKLRCGLDATGTCAVKASVSAAVAKRIGLKAGKRAKTVGVGSGSAQVAGGKIAALKVKLTGEARVAIDAATKPVPIALAVTGSAQGSESATLSAKLKIKRP